VIRAKRINYKKYHVRPVVVLRSTVFRATGQDNQPGNRYDAKQPDQLAKLRIHVRPSADVYPDLPFNSSRADRPWRDIQATECSPAL
jgi:hypothetical protein